MTALDCVDSHPRPWSPVEYNLRTASIPFRCQDIKNPQTPRSLSAFNPAGAVHTYGVHGRTRIKNFAVLMFPSRPSSDVHSLARTFTGTYIHATLNAQRQSSSVISRYHSMSPSSELGPKAVQTQKYASYLLSFLCRPQMPQIFRKATYRCGIFISLRGQSVPILVSFRGRQCLHAHLPPKRPYLGLLHGCPRSHRGPRSNHAIAL